MEENLEKTPPKRRGRSLAKAPLEKQESLSSDYIERLKDLAVWTLDRRKAVIGQDTREELNAHLDGISEQALSQWRRGVVTNSPKHRTLEGLRRYLRISAETMESYLDRGEIAIEVLWKRRGEETIIVGAVSVDSVVVDFSCLPLEEQVEGLTRIAAILREQILENKDKVVKKIKFATTREIDRLSKLREASHYYRRTKDDDILRSGGSRELLTALIDKVPTLEFSVGAWESLLPFLIRPVAWRNDRPVPDADLTTLEGDIDAFEREIRG